MMGGTNEAQQQRANLIAYSPLFQNCVAANVSWAGLPYSRKMPGSSVTSLPSGWTYDNTYSQVEGVQSDTNGASVTFPSLTVDNVNEYGFIWYRLISNNAGTANWEIVQDSTSTVVMTGTINATLPDYFQTNIGTTTSVGVVITPSFGSTEGSYHLVVTTTSATGSTNNVSVLGYSIGFSNTFYDQYTGSPTVYVADVPFMANDLFAQSTKTFSTLLIDQLSTLQQDGIPVNFVPVRNYWHGTYPEYAIIGGVISYPHPNLIGEQEIANAFLSPTALAQTPPLTIIPTPVVTTTVNTVPCTSGSACTIDTSLWIDGVSTPSTSLTAPCTSQGFNISANITVTLPTGSVACSTGKIITLVNAANPGGNSFTLTPVDIFGYTGISLTVTPGETVVAEQASSTIWRVIQTSYSNARGSVVLVAGTATISTNLAQSLSTDNYQLTNCAASGTLGDPAVGAISPGTSFTINSYQPGATTPTIQTGDTSTICWRLN
jgi:hypothetical protein